MKRIIQQHIKHALADELLFGQLAEGGAVVVDVDDTGLTIKTIPAKPGKAAPQPVATLSE